MGQGKKTVAEIFEANELHGGRPVGGSNINGEPVPKVLQSGTKVKVNYNRMMKLWD